jgi:hypothetical protein
LNWASNTSLAGSALGPIPPTILKAEGEAEAIKLVNEAANKYFVDNAQTLRKLQAVEISLQHAAKIVVPAGGSRVPHPSAVSKGGAVFG